MNSSTLHTILILLTIVLLGATVWFVLPIVQSLSLDKEGVPYITMNNDTSGAGITEQLFVMQDHFASGEPQKAIQYAEDQILAKDIPMSIQERTQLKLQLARAYIPVDYTRSIALFKEVAADDAVAPERGAFALQALGDLYLLHSRAAEIAHFIFLDEEYGHMLDLSDDLPIMHALRNMYAAVLSYGDDAGPQPIAHYRLSELYFEELFSSRVDSQLRTETDLLAKAKSHYSEGVLDQAASSDANLDPTNNSIYINGLKALVSGYLALEEDNEELHIQARDLYTRTIALLVDHGGSEAIREYFVGWTNLNYAIYLNESGGETDTIRNALQVIVDTHAGQNSIFTGWMWRLSDSETEFAGLRSKIVDVSEHNTDFARMLVNLGWTL